MAAFSDFSDPKKGLTFSRMQQNNWKVNNRAYSWSPPTDIYETQGKLVIKIEIAGMKQSDITINIENKVLSISGTRKEIVESRSYHQIEIRFGDSEASLEELFLPNILKKLTKKDQDNQLEKTASDTQSESIEFPQIIPILPLRGVVVFPQTAVPLTIGQARSIKLVDDAAGGDRLIGWVASRKPDTENPSSDELYTVGTIAIIHRLFRAPDDTIRLLVQGLARFKIREFVQNDPYFKASIDLVPETIESGLEIDALARNARDQFEHIAEINQSIPRELATTITALDDPLQTVYTISNFQRIELEDAQRILELDSTLAKLHKLIGFLVREGEVLNLGQKIQNEARSEIEKVQRDYFLREQLKAIQKEL